MENILNDLLFLLKKQSDDLAILRSKMDELETAQHFPGWIPRKSVMYFLDYRETQIAALLKDPNLIVCEVGARKFIEKKSFLKFLEKNIKSSEKK